MLFIICFIYSFRAYLSRIRDDHDATFRAASMFRKREWRPPSLYSQAYGECPQEKMSCDPLVPGTRSYRLIGRSILARRGCSVSIWNRFTDILFDCNTRSAPRTVICTYCYCYNKIRNINLSISRFTLEHFISLSIRPSTCERADVSGAWLYGVMMLMLVIACVYLSTNKTQAQANTRSRITANAILPIWFAPTN